MQSEKVRYLFKLYYIGSKQYHGSQRQNNFWTIERCIIEAFKKKKYIKNFRTSGFEVASRTDKLVSARGASFSFLTAKEPILMEINSELPKEIGLWAYTRVPNHFSSRFNALLRHYKYFFPLDSQISQKFNLDLINQMCEILEGQHDFKNFAKREKNDLNTIRTLDLATANLQENCLIFEFKSKSYLRQQIRRMVAKLIEVGTGILSNEDFLKLFDPSSYISYQPANPVGLILWDIKYQENIKFEIDLKSVNRMMNYLSREEQTFNRKRFLFHILQHDNVS